MRVRLDADVRTKDGHRAGAVKKVVFDPTKNEVSAYVVSTGGLLGHDVIVSPEVLERASDGEEVVLDMTKSELDGLERYEETAYAPPPSGWLAPASYAFPSAAYMFPFEAGVPLATPVPEERRPPRPTIAEGMKVKDATGVVIGTVREVRVDDMTGELRSVVVRDGGPLASDEDVMEISADHIDIGGDELHIIEQGGAPATKRDGS